MTEADELLLLKKELHKCKLEREQLKAELETNKLIQIEKERELTKLLYDKSLLIEKETIFLLQEQKLKTEVQPWQRFTDEIAHSINTDVYIAVSNLDKHRDLPKINKAFYHIKQIRDLTNLIMWYIKRNELKPSGELSEISINKILSQQILDIKDGVSTLRISSDEHQENIIKLEIPIESDSEFYISINKEIADAIPLVIKDLLRNAVKNTDEENPQVKIKIYSNDIDIIIEIQNNKAIPEEFSKWFNGESKEEPTKVSKSFKVGLRIIKMWIELLKIDVKLLPDYQNNTTLTRIIFPKEIKYAAN